MKKALRLFTVFLMVSYCYGYKRDLQKTLRELTIQLTTLSNALPSTKKPTRPAAKKPFANQLFAEVNKAIKSGKPLTQSQAHMSVPAIQKDILKLPNLEKHQAIIEAALQREQKYRDYYVVYTSVPGMRVLQDVTRLLYEANLGQRGALKENAFQFIRYTYKDEAYNAYKNAQEFLLSEIKNYGIVDDNVSRVKTVLLSVNLSILGNAGLEGESTYHYFNEPQAWIKDETKEILLRNSLGSFGYSPKFASELIKLQNNIKTNYGDLFQIFIPRNKVDLAGYVSWRQGIPFDYDFIKYLMKKQWLIFSKEGGILGPVITNRIEEFQQKWQKKEAQARKYSEQLLKNVKAGKYKLSTFLDAYRKNPTSIKDLDFHQARLVITNSLLLNPEGGIRIYRYSTLSRSKEDAYKATLKKIIDKIIVSRKK